MLWMTDAQGTQLQALVKRACPHYECEECLLLWDLEERKCSQMILKNLVVCEHCSKIVLPLDPELLANIEHFNVERQNGSSQK